MRAIVLILCILFTNFAFAGKIYKCTKTDGKVSYQNQPCKDGKEKLMSELSTDGGQGKIFYAPGDSDDSDILLYVKSWNCIVKRSYIYVQGEVKNISAYKLKNVVAVGNFRTSGGELVDSDTSLLEYNPLMPGQTSPFKVMQKNNPMIKSCSVAFKYLSGAGISFRQ